MTISATTRGLRPGVCTSTTRPGSPFDGQLIYETDTNRVAVYDTNAWVYKTPDTTAGSVLQVASTTKSDTFTTTSATYADVTGLSVTITPRFSTSRILLVASITATADSTTQGFAQFVRDSTAIGIGDAGGSRVRSTFPIYIQGNAFNVYSSNASFFDSPATTSATTYKIQVRRESTSGTIFINRSPNDSDSAAGGRFISTITVMEIAQ